MTGLALRDYQTECLRAIGARYQAGVRRQLVCLPTGTGKTVIFAEFPRFFRMKKRLLVLAHREELLDQAREKILRANPELCVEIEQAGRRASVDTNVVVASVATLVRSELARLKALNPDDFFLIVVDEAHHAIAPTYQDILTHLGVFAPDTRKLLVGFTATPKRGDSQGLDAVFEEISYARDLPDMVRAGYLSPLAAYRVETDIDLAGVKTRMGDFVTSQLSQAVNITERNELVVRMHQQYLQSRPTLCFCVDVAHTHKLAEAFTKAGIAAAAVTGEMDRTDRARVLAGFAAGKYQVLTNCMVLTEGYDESSVAGILLARPTKSALLYTQMIGRGTRLHPGKDNVTIVDIVDATRQHQLVTINDLFGLPENFDLAGKTTQEAVEALRWAEEHRPWVRADLARSFDDLRYRCKKINLLDLETPEQVQPYSEYAWTQLGRDAYRLGLAGGETITVASNILGQWEAVLRNHSGMEIIAQGKHAREAILRADLFIADHRKESVPLIFRQTRWRKEPATEKQLQLLRGKGLEIPPGLTKGQASHLISMVVH